MAWSWTLTRSQGRSMLRPKPRLNERLGRWEAHDMWRAEAYIVTQAQLDSIVEAARRQPGVGSREVIGAHVQSSSDIIDASREALLQLRHAPGDIVPLLSPDCFRATVAIANAYMHILC